MEIPNDLQKLMKVSGTRLKPKNGENSRIGAIQTAEMLDEYYIYSESKHDKALQPVRDAKMDETWKESLRENPEKFWWFEQPINDWQMEKLRDRLLSFGGEAVCLPWIEEDIANILKYGQFWLGKNALFMRGEPSRCHRNSGLLYEANPSATRICTGYALSSDGMWRQHSWLINYAPRSNRIVESTTKRVAYYGFVMNEEMCELFVSENV